jgi:adenosylmethionine---8-amino-7-oxononanoate aminotransferase
MTDWRERDRKVLWHPFTQHQLWEEEDFPVIVSGKGSWLVDAEGRRYLDGVASLWLNVHGHNRPELNATIEAQLGQIAHSTFLGLSHPLGIELAERLLTLAPPGLSRVFFSDNGSTAVEAALKMAFQYWVQKSPAAVGRKTFISFTNAYHGDTIGSVSLGGVAQFHELYRPLLFPVIRVPAPYCYRCPFKLEPAACDREKLVCLKALQAALEERGPEVAGIVIEPLIQAAAGMLAQPAGFLRGVRELCDRFGTLMIADEVATGFGHTGTLFACEQEAVTPDLLALGKGLTGGYLPLAATLATEEIFSAFLGPQHSERTFFHGHSYTANPLACAAAKASLALFEQDRTLMNVRSRARQLETGLAEIQTLPHVGDVRQKGLMAGIELVRDKLTREPCDPRTMTGRQVILAARKRGVILRPLGDVIVLMPPLCVSGEEMELLLQVVSESILEVVTKND